MNKDENNRLYDLLEIFLQLSEEEQSKLLDEITLLCQEDLNGGNAMTDKIVLDRQNNIYTINGVKVSGITELSATLSSDDMAEVTIKMCANVIIISECKN